MAYQFNEWQEKWLQALESGEYEQGQLFLRTGDGRYCCLGVGAVVCGVDPNDLGEADTLADLPDVSGALKLRSENGRLAGYYDGYVCLTELNDTAEMTFAEIAAFIRANPEKVFTDAV